MLWIDSSVNILNELEEYQEELNRETFVLVDEEKYKNSVRYYEGRKLTLFNELALKTNLYSEGKYPAVTGNGLEVVYTLNAMGVPDSKMEARESGEFTTSQEVLGPLEEGMSDESIKIGPLQEEAIDLLQTFLKYKKAKTLASGNSKISKWQETGKVNRFGKSLKKAGFHYHRSITYRDYSREDSIQNWAKKYVKSITEEDGFVIVAIDLKQVDFRVLYNLMLRTQDNFEDFLKFDDSYKSMYKIICTALGIKFDETEFKDIRKDFKTYVLSKAYRSSNTKFGNPKVNRILKILDDYYNKAEKYMDYSKTADVYIRNQLDTQVNDYFGVPAIVEWDAHNPMSKYCNYFVQSTSAEIIKIVSLRILKKFYSLGYTPDDICLKLNRHDETLFKVRRSMLKDSWVFKDYSRIQIDDWSMLGYTVSISDYYTEENPEYMKEYEESWKSKLGENLEYESKPGEVVRRIEQYSPIPDAFVVLSNIQKPEEVVEYYRTNVDSSLTNDELVQHAEKYFTGNLSFIKDILDITEKSYGFMYVVNMTKGIAFKVTYRSLEEVCKVTKAKRIFTINCSEKVENYPVEIIRKSIDRNAKFRLLSSLEAGIGSVNRYYRVETSTLAKIL